MRHRTARGSPQTAHRPYYGSSTTYCDTETFYIKLTPRLADSGDGPEMNRAGICD